MAGRRALVPLSDSLVFTAPDGMRAWSTERRSHGRSIGFVPTMGALHAGHIALIEHARGAADDVVVSIFVNPLQFNQPADFDHYPRPIDEDLAICGELGVAAVFAPTGAVMYPDGFETTVSAGAMAEPMEGSHRPGHFDGVVTVLTKLFSIVRPDLAVFGEKDYQQLAVVRRLSADLDLDVSIVAHPTVREPDGLALSSRNRRLDAASRSAAVVIPTALSAAAACAADGGEVADVIAAAHDAFAGESAAHVEYVAVFDGADLQPVDSLAGRRQPGRVRIATAVEIGGVRLIDNRDLFDG